MSEFKPTPAQERAIHERGGAMLVSAGAGAGKTRVLVERLMAHLDEGHSLNEFLVITYTKAAAAELRERIFGALSARLSEHPDNRHLRRQLTGLSGCDICTIHALCKRILEEHPASEGLRPGARLLDGADRDLLLSRVLDGLLEDCYEAMEEPFAVLVSAASDARGDDLLVQLILTVFEKTRGHPDPEGWMMEQEQIFFHAAGQPIEDTIWGDILLEAARRLVSYGLEVLRKIRDEIQAAPAVDEAYGPAFRTDIQWAERMEEAISHGWEAVRDVTRNLTHARLKRTRNWDDEDFLDRCKSARERWKDRSKKLAKLLDGSEASHNEDFRVLAPVVRALFGTVRRLAQALEEEKRRLNVVDFHDLEHRALALLAGSDRETPSPLAARLSRRYTEIMVDEYQDISLIQERIVWALSRSGGNLYWVGDVRQSIYRFRLAEPALFLEKYNTFPDVAPPGKPRRVLLGDNFRSRPEVLDAVNALFADIMSPEIGEMAYTAREFLRSAGTFPDHGNDYACELLLADRDMESPAEEGEERASPVQAEAGLVAERIIALLRENIPICEKDSWSRPVRPGDIAILMRAPSLRAAVYVKALTDAGIPCQTDGGGDFFLTPEILTALALLRVIDNPRQDVAMLAALRCPAWDFDAGRLARMRAACPGGDIMDALEMADANGDAAARSFLSKLELWRLLAPDLTVSEMLARVYTDTKLAALYGTLSDGPARRDNLAQLLTLAGQFDAGRTRGLPAFLRWADSLCERGETAARPAADADVVSVMSIHRSKGLEFPIVILADAAKRFNEADVRAPVLFHPQAGLGLNRRDQARMIEYPTLSRRAVACRLTDEMLAEEMRMLYVAMTRAKEKLIVTAAPASASDALSKWDVPLGDIPLPPQMVSEGRSYLDWLSMHLAHRAGTPLWRVEVVKPRHVSVIVAPLVGQSDAEPPDPVLVEEISRRLGYVYPHHGAVTLPSKLTATALKGRGLDDEITQDAQPAPAERSFDRPRFLREEIGALTPAERGTALHLFMQFADFARCLTRPDAEKERRRLAGQGFLTEAQAAAVDAGRVSAFFASPLGRRVLAAGTLIREWKFSLMVPAVELLGQGEGEEILLQGVVDCCFEERQGFVVVDFKTDFLIPGSESERAAYYRPQVAAYARALHAIMGKPVSECLLYFFATGTAVSLGAL